MARPYGVPEGGEGIFTGGIPADLPYFGFTGGDPKDRSNYNLGGEEGPISLLARLDPPVRTENYGVPMGMPTFRGNFGIPQYGAAPPMGEEEGSSKKGSDFLNSVLAGLVPTLGPAIGTGLSGLLDDFLGGDKSHEDKPFEIEGAVGDFGPFGSEVIAMSNGAAGSLGNIVNAFTGAMFS